MNSALAKAQGIANKFRTERAAAGVPAKGIVAKRAESNGRLYIYSEIGGGYFNEGVTAAGVQAALAELSGVTSLDIYVNCEGGDVFEAKAIYSQLKRFPAQKTVYIDGIAASAATFLVMAADRIVIASLATFMIHEAHAIAMGEATDFRAMADLLDLQCADLAQIYAVKTGKTPAEMRALMAAETWMSAQQALDAGFVDEVTDGTSAASTNNSSKVSPLAAAAARTQELIASISPAQLLTAKAEMHRLRNLPSTRPAAQRPAASAFTRRTGTKNHED